LKEVKPFVEEGVGSHIIIKGLKAARDLVCVLIEPRTSLIGQAVQKINEIAVTIDKTDAT